MNKRPTLNKNLDSNTFRSYYYLKEELIAFCRNNGLLSSGGKIKISDRIGKGFSFNVVFQKWLKSNTGKTYG